MSDYVTGQHASLQCFVDADLDPQMSCVNLIPSFQDVCNSSPTALHEERPFVKLKYFRSQQLGKRNLSAAMGSGEDTSAFTGIMPLKEERGTQDEGRNSFGLFDIPDITTPPMSPVTTTPPVSPSPTLKTSPKPTPASDDKFGIFYDTEADLSVDYGTSLSTDNDYSHRPAGSIDYVADVSQGYGTETLEPLSTSSDDAGTLRVQEEDDDSDEMERTRRARNHALCLLREEQARVTRMLAQEREDMELARSLQEQWDEEASRIDRSKNSANPYSLRNNLHKKKELKPSTKGGSMSRPRQKTLEEAFSVKTRSGRRY